MNAHSVILHRSRSSDFNFSDVLGEMNDDDLADAMIFCFTHLESIPTVFIHNLEAVSRLNKRHWKRIIESTRAVDEYWLRSFYCLLQNYCRIDPSYLQEIGIPEESVTKFSKVVSDPLFAHTFLPLSENVDPVTKREREQGLAYLKSVGFSEADRLTLFNMFTNPNNTHDFNNLVPEPGVDGVQC
jgi:hypothetical protein